MITAAQVKELREKTGAGMMECKKVLTETEGNQEKAIELLKYLVKGARITSITGEHGCGKTTLLMGMIENIYETMNIRVQETAFELHLRKIYPTRNILSFRETDTISGQQGLDVQKKTDGSVNIIRRSCN